MNHIKCLLYSLLLSSLVTPVFAQNTVPATGGNATGNGGSASYTVGQIIYNTISGTNGTVSQGVQQPYEISVVTALEVIKDISLICSLYPNPTANFLTLKVVDNVNAKLSYWLYGVNGNLIETKKILTGETQISLENQVSGTYFLKMISGNNEIKTFKIIKN